MYLITSLLGFVNLLFIPWRTCPWLVLIQQPIQRRVPIPILFQLALTWYSDSSSQPLGPSRRLYLFISSQAGSRLHETLRSRRTLRSDLIIRRRRWCFGINSIRSVQVPDLSSGWGDSTYHIILVIPPQMAGWRSASDSSIDIRGIEVRQLSNRYIEAVRVHHYCLRFRPPKFKLYQIRVPWTYSNRTYASDIVPQLSQKPRLSSSASFQMNTYDEALSRVSHPFSLYTRFRQQYLVAGIGVCHC
jgi:hypothetical protein